MASGTRHFPGHHLAASNKFLRLLFLVASAFLTVFLCYKMSYVYTYYVRYSADQLVPAHVRTCDVCTNTSSVIPRILHHSWKNHTIPWMWTHTYQSCLDAHHDYKHMLWTDEDIDNFIRDHYSWFYPTYTRYQYNIERADAARYFILYHYGGVYVDLDVGCRMSTHDILTHTEGYKVIIPEGYPTGLTNWYMASTAQHPLFQRAIKSLQKARGVYGTPYMDIMWSTGPMFLTKVASRTPECRTDMMILRFSHLFLRYFWKAPGGSWHQPDAIVFLFLRDVGMNWKPVICGIWATTLIIVAAVCICKRRKLSPCFYKEIQGTFVNTRDKYSFGRSRI